jgi:hypothetical protein
LTCGKLAGRPLASAWQVTQDLLVGTSTSVALATGSLTAWTAAGPWQLSQETSTCVLASCASTSGAWHAAHEAAPAKRGSRAAQAWALRSFLTAP